MNSKKLLKDWLSLITENKATIRAEANNENFIANLIRETQLEIDKPEDFKEVTMPVIKYLCENQEPHHTIIITSVRAELLAGINDYKTDEFVLD